MKKPSKPGKAKSRSIKPHELLAFVVVETGIDIEKIKKWTIPFFFSVLDEIGKRGEQD